MIDLIVTALGVVLTVLIALTIIFIVEYCKKPKKEKSKKYSARKK